MGQRRPGEYFRAGVGAMIVDSTTRRVLVFRRADVRDTEAWQLPQGGLRSGEKPRDALLREVAEETGLSSRDYVIAAELDDWLVYELPADYRSPKTGRGQVQKWFLLELRTADDVHIEPDLVEFDRCRWVHLQNLVSLVAPFRRSIYSKLVDLAVRTWPKGT